IWADFAQALLEGQITSSRCYRALQNTVPTGAHKAIADLYEYVDATCISLNFDGLTWKALREKPGGTAVVLDSKEACERYYTRYHNLDHPAENGAATGKSMRAVVKMRGDVFYARCQTSGCPKEGTPRFLWDRPPVDTESPSVQPRGTVRNGITQPVSGESSLLKCPECGRVCRLEIVFPGVLEKEETARGVLEALATYLVPRLSCIISAGFSGNWDPLLVRFIAEVLAQRKVPLIDIKPERPRERDVLLTLIEEARNELGLSLSRRIPEDAQSVLPKLTENVGSVKQKRNKVLISLGNARKPLDGKSLDDELDDEQLVSRWMLHDGIWGNKTPTILEVKLMQDRHLGFDDLARFQQLGLKRY
ncbi:MAG: hypothetical protein H5T92_09770, partial [Synergistales bacterium]|nr:hypothetical protein [Synergistales bacterium]